MTYNVAIANHFESRFRTSSKIDITGSTTTKVFIAFLKFEGNDYMYIKNYTSYPIDISGQIFIGSKNLVSVVDDSEIDFFKNEANFSLMSFKVMAGCTYDFETSESISQLMDYEKLTNSEVSIVDYTDFKPLKHQLQISDLYEYMYKVDITQYINHFSKCDGGVIIKYKTSCNTLLEATIIDDWLYMNDARSFEKYMSKLDHTLKYNSDMSYQREWDTMARELNGLLQACDYDALKKIMSGIKSNSF